MQKAVGHPEDHDFEIIPPDESHMKGAAAAPPPPSQTTFGR